MAAQRIILAVAVALAVVVAFLWGANQLLRRELASVQNKLDERDAVIDTEKPAPDRNRPEVEDLRSRIVALSNRVTHLETELAESRRSSVQAAKSQATRSEPSAASHDEAASQLTELLLNGDFAPLETLAEMVQQASSAGRPNMTPEEQETYVAKLRPFWEAFDVLASEASSGNTNALQALAGSARMSELSGLAMKSLGKLAGAGSEGALNILLDPQRFGVDVPLATTVQAMRPAAEGGNPRAIEALAALANDDGHQALWYMAADALGRAAGAGDWSAIEALLSFSRSTNQNVLGAVRRGLGAAAANQDARAIEALRMMDGQRSAQP